MNKVAIIYYHRINDLSADYNHTNVKPVNFKDQMQIIADKYDVVSIEDIHNGTAFNRNKNAVALTFDDGYKDVLCNAAPILKLYQFPFTCLITTGNIYTDKENWTDFVTRVAFEPEVFHERCELIISGKKNEYKTGSIEDRVVFYRSLQQLFKLSSGDDWNDIVHQLVKWSGISLKARKAFSIMNAQEIDTIREMGGVIGAHTVSHPFLSFKNKEDAYREIYESKCTLEKILGENVYIFSYPFGDTPKECRYILEDCGYKVAMTSNHGLVSNDSDLMYLPRIGIKDYSKKDFEKKLEQLFR